ncbi:MAG: thioredoxin domain-containing protein [Acidobacteria bacterium]|nr:thioredoxin domain-containing protein [Acidobacteriota bacterium]
MITVMRLFAICALLLALACSTPAQQVPAGQSAPAASDVAARFGERAITVKELDDRWRADQPSAHAQAVQAMYDGRKDALDALIAESLIEEAAKKAGVTPTQYAETEMAKRSKPVTDGQVAAFFQENQGQMQGRGFDAMAATIRRYLDDQQRSSAYTALVGELRKSGPALRMTLDAPRYEVNVTADDATIGDAKAVVTLVEFSDFQCPFCARVMPTLKRIKDTYGDRVRIVWKDFPLTAIHPQAFRAAEAGQCAREQGKFWEYHDRLFANQQALDVEFLKKYAADAGLDATKFGACMDTAKYGDRVQEQMGIGTRLGVESTPTTFVNGRLVSGAQPYEVFAAIIDEELERAAK